MPRHQLRRQFLELEANMQGDDHFFLVAGGHIFFQAMSAGVSLDLFTLLHREPGLDRGTIASRLGIEAQPTRILLLALAACKMLQKTDDSYYNVASGERWLSRDMAATSWL
jgi:hypothetical protein